MNPSRLVAVFGLVTLGIAHSTFGDPPEFGQTEESAQIQQLRREVEELKQTVEALRTRLSELEYQGLPQAPMLLSRGKVPDSEAPDDVPAGYLRFPFNIERANFAPPPRWHWQERVR